MNHNKIKNQDRLAWDTANKTEHYRMYKSGKNWVYGLIFSVSLGIGMTDSLNVKADVTSETVQVQTEVVNNESNAVSNATSSAAVSEASSTATTTKSNSSATDDSKEAKSEADSKVAKTTPENSNEKTTSVAEKSEKKTDSKSDKKASADVRKENTSSAALNSEKNNSKMESASPAKTVSKEAVQPNKDSSPSVKLTVDVPEDIQPATNKNDDEITKGSTYSGEGNSGKKVVAKNVQNEVNTAAKLAANPTMSGKIILGNATKTYDDSVDTPVTFQVKLPNGVTQPQSWYLSGQSGMLIALGSGDIDLTQISQDVGVYTVTLTAAGLAKIQAANPKLSISMSDVTPGTLTITKALVPSQSIKITGQSKDYDNNASNMPSTYQVSVPNNLSVPATWTHVADANGMTVYEVPASFISGVNSQKVGTYQITLSDSALSDLQAVNANYDINDDSIMNSTFIIKSNISLVAGSTTIMKTEQDGNASLPKTLSVSISRDATVPSDWTVRYDNTGQNVKVYDVPISYFDVSAVDVSKIGEYEVGLSTQAIADIRSANPSAKLEDINIQTGIITVSKYVKKTGTFTPGNYFVTIKGGGKYISVGSGLELELRLLNSNNPDLVKNLTEYIIIPNGFAVGSIDSNGNYSLASDPAAVLKKSIEDELVRTGSDFSGQVEVQQLTDYKGRQTFKIQFVGEIHSAAYNNKSYVANLHIIAVGKEGTSGNIGTSKGANDESVMYVTSDANATGGNYNISASGYDNIRDVANALGIVDAYALNQGYTGFVYPYTIVQGSVKDTYNLVGPDKKTILDTKTTTGKSMTTYDPMSFLPAKFEKNGHKYVLVVSSVVTPQKYKQITNAFNSADTVIDGITYTVYYQEIIDKYDDSNQVVVQGATKIYDGDESTDPSSYDVFVPNGYTVPSNWKATNLVNVYTIQVSSGDLDVSGINSQNPGSYTVILTDQGLNKFAAANPMYLVTKDVGRSALFVITPITTTHFVDQNGNKVSSDIIDNTHVYHKGDQYTTTAPKNIDDYTLIGTSDNANGTFSDDNIEVTYVYTKTSDLNQDVTETIHYVDAKTGQQLAATYTKTVHYSRVAHVHFNSDGTSSVTYDAWQNDGKFDAVISPVIKGYVADRSSVEAFEVTEPTADMNLTVYYYGDQTVNPTDPKDPGTPVDPKNPLGPDYPEGTTEKDLNQDVTETIHYVDAKTGQQLSATYTKTVHYSRVAHVHFNSDGTSSVTYDAWKADGKFDAVISPLIKGYVADRLIIQAFEVNEPMADMILNVYYTANETSNPDNNGNDSNGGHDIDGNGNNSNNETSNITTSNNVTVGRNNTRVEKYGSVAKKLPQTGDEDNTSTSAIGVLGLLAGMFGLVGFAKKRKR